jgi:hypothetical protein
MTYVHTKMMIGNLCPSYCAIFHIYVYEFFKRS